MLLPALEWVGRFLTEAAYGSQFRFFRGVVSSSSQKPDTSLATWNGAVRRQTEWKFKIMTALLEPAVVRNTYQDISIRRILLVDDEIGLWWDRNLAALSAAGYNVDTAEDGETGWEALQTTSYDLLITDNKMPKLWGLELIERLRDHGMTLPIILASTCLPFASDVNDVHLLEKPVSSSLLLSTVQYSLRGN
jgi:CheY-like chemotaxis protein